ncbi:helix-turn-helix domain-containing protein [uncultured Alistipes sp.]|uniref:helix-turn-helix domain-containing protein n=1 Tax=uncultured Alistipes sp. TaxID=538949 RepID=UPI0025CEC3F8|nr:helix-turn-helix domain-containing protein [uncultured Alistipes sp.]
MSPTNPLETSVDEPFVVGESDFAYFSEQPQRCESGAILLCVSGSARVEVDQVQGLARRDTLVFVLGGWLLRVAERSDDFRLAYCAFSRDLFAEAAYRIEPAFFRALHDQPISYTVASIAEGAAVWLKMADYTYRDRENLFRNTIIKNRLQNMLLDIYDKYQRYGVRRQRTPEVGTRLQELFHRFVALVHENCTRQREVSFYADRLCISTRYLSTVVGKAVHIPVKEFIDRAVLTEMKMLLQSTDLSVQQIAFRMHFPDQSYMGRFFKKYTGQSPTEYRRMKR